MTLVRLHKAKRRDFQNGKTRSLHPSFLKSHAAKLPLDAMRNNQTQIQLCNSKRMRQPKAVHRHTEDRQTKRQRVNTPKADTPS